LGVSTSARKPLSGNDRNSIRELSFLLLYAITNRKHLAGTDDERTRHLVEVAALWSAHDVPFVQIREKDLSPAGLIQLASTLVIAVRQAGGRTQVLINWDPADPKTAMAIARDAGADGVHLPSGLAEEQLRVAIREIRDGLGGHAPISVSCHSSEEVSVARNGGASLALFAPIFEKVVAGNAPLRGNGLKALAEACTAAGREDTGRPPMRVLALGGITFENARQCVDAGAAGVAAIRLFQQGGEEREREWRTLASYRSTGGVRGDNLELSIQ